MIYPKTFPTENDNKAERQVFLALDKLDKNDYDVFFSRKFSLKEEIVHKDLNQAIKKTMESISLQGKIIDFGFVNTEDEK